MRAVAIAALLLASCAAHRPEPRKLDEPFKLAYRQSAEIKGEGLSLTFSVVNEDSRCPTGATCITAGRAAITVKALKGASTADLRLTMPGGATAGFQAYSITFVELTPHPAVDHLPEHTEYTATLQVERR